MLLVLQCSSVVVAPVLQFALGCRRYRPTVTKRSIFSPHRRKVCPPPPPLDTRVGSEPHLTSPHPHLTSPHITSDHPCCVCRQKVERFVGRMRRGTGGDDTRRVTTAEASSGSRVKSRRATCTLFYNRQVCFFASVRFSSVLFLFFGHYSCLYLSRADDRSAAAGLELPPLPQLMMAEVRGRNPRHGVFRNFLFLFLFLLSLPPSIYYISYS